MSKNEKRLSAFIDSLNKEEEPVKGMRTGESSELEKLCNTVRIVRSMRDPAIPDESYPVKLSKAVSKRLTPETSVKFHKQAWVAGFATSLLILAVVVTTSFVLPAKPGNIVYAMENSFQELKAYHGFLEIVTTNGQGKSDTWGELEIWADRDGHYYERQLEGRQKDVVTTNNGKQKWQIWPDQKEVHVFQAFPDPYRFSFEMGKEVDQVKSAVETKVVGEETISGRGAYILEVKPMGGDPYRIWVDKETKLPLQKSYGLENGVAYRLTYTRIDFAKTIPAELTTLNIPAGYKEVVENPEQSVPGPEEAGKIAGFELKLPSGIPSGYVLNDVTVEPGTKVVRLYYSGGTGNSGSKDRVVVLQKKSDMELVPEANLILGRIGGDPLEIRLPSGIFEGTSASSGNTGIGMLHWQHEGMEFKVEGNASFDDLKAFAGSLSNGAVDIPSQDGSFPGKPQVEVPVDLNEVENSQKSVDAGHSPWQLDPLFVAQVFASLQVSPGGITGDYPVKIEDMKIIQNNGVSAIVEIKAKNAFSDRIYLKRLIRPDPTGIWSVVGYDPAKRQ